MMKIGMVATASVGPFETAHFARDGVHPEGGAQRVIAEITAKAIREL